MSGWPDLLGALDAADGRRDGDFIRALADLVDAGELEFEPELEPDIPAGTVPEEFGVNIDWGFWVPNAWLEARIKGTVVS